jgi:hypothetical protein
VSVGLFIGLVLGWLAFYMLVVEYAIRIESRRRNGEDASPTRSAE